MIRPISKTLGAFTPRDLQMFRTVIMTMERDEITLDAVLRYIHDATACPPKARKFCSECGGAMQLFRVNTGKADHVGGKYKTQWWCGLCGHDEFSRKTVHEQMLRLQNRYPVTSTEDSAFLIDSGVQSPFNSICPNCDQRMPLWRVNTPHGKANIHGYRSVWQCGSCGYEQYSTRNLKEEATTLRRI